MKNIILILFTFLFFTQTSEAQWYIQQSGTTDPLYDIEFANKNTGWACGDGGYIIKTTNGGDNWIRQANGVTSEPLFGISVVDSNTVYAAGFYRTLLKTTDGGDNWILKESGMAGDGRYTCVFFIDQNKGWIGNFGPGYGIMKTSDGGNTIQSVPFNGIPQDLYFKDSLNGVGVGEVSYIYRTTNGGNNWISSSIVFNGNLYRVSFINDNTGYTASSRAVYKTTNFGVTWDSVGHIPLTQGSVYSINFANENTGWAGTNAPVYKTTDGGTNWSLQMITGVVNTICSINDSLVWTCGNAGRIWHTTTGGISFVNNISSFIPDNFELFQNYPNPFNGQTKISFNIKQSDIYNLEIYNSIGQKVLVVFNRQFIPGTYETNIDANTLGSGIHFYKLNGSKNSITKKFLLVK
jgi:photosystem II stability/assembly factor-like uncharacterized protein